MSASQDKLIDIFNHIDQFFRRLEIYINIRPTSAMSDIIVKIMVEVLIILGIATKEVKCGRFSELMSCISLFLLTGYSERYIKMLTGKREIKDSLERLDKLTREESQMASAEQLRMTQVVDDRVRGVGGQVQGVRDDVHDVRGDVQDVRDEVKDVSNKVQDVDDRVQAIDSNVRGVDDKLEQANRSLSYNP